MSFIQTSLKLIVQAEIFFTRKHYFITFLNCGLNFVIFYISLVSIT